MANRILNQVYSLLYNETLSKDDYNQRLKMQKGVCLLEELGIPVGGYAFTQYKGGSYSQTLNDDIESAGECESVKLTCESLRTIIELSQALIPPDGSMYNRQAWAVCMDAMRYFKYEYCQMGAMDEDILDEVDKQRPHLCHREENKIALERVTRLFESHKGGGV